MDLKTQKLGRWRFIFLSLLTISSLTNCAQELEDIKNELGKTDNSSSATEYVVKYFSNGATSGSAPVDSAKYEAGDTVTVKANLGNLQKGADSFNGWNTKSDGTGESYLPGSELVIAKADVELYANWGTPRFVTYNANGATSGTVPVDSTTYQNNGTVNVLGNTGNLAKSGQLFTGWNTASNGSGDSYAPGATFNVSANVTLYAQWGSSYSVTYHANGADSGSVPATVSGLTNGQSYSVASNTGNLAKNISGVVFIGWNTAANGSGTFYAPSSNLTLGNSNLVLYAQWQLSYYSVTYNSNGATSGSIPNDNQQYSNGQSFVVQGANLVKTGKQFDGWNTAANGSGSSYSINQQVQIQNANVILYAKWVDSSGTNETFTITYNANGATSGSVPVDSAQYEYDEVTYILGNSANLAKTSKVFGGWNLDNSGVIMQPGAMISLRTNHTFYAVWNNPPAAPESTIFTGYGPDGTNLNYVKSVIYADGKYVAAISNISNRGISTSNDGENWTLVEHSAQNPNTGLTGVFDVAYDAGNDTFVAVGTSGVLTSNDAESWTVQTEAEDNWWHSVTYGNGTFVAVSRNGTNRIMTSTDGETWIARSAPGNKTWDKVIYAGGKFVAVGVETASSPGAGIMTSTDGETWTARDAGGASDLRGIAYGNGIYVAVGDDGDIVTSTDAITWTKRTAPAGNFWSEIAFGNGMFVAVASDGTGRVMTSTNGTSWDWYAAAQDDKEWLAITYHNGRFVALAAGYGMYWEYTP